MGFTKFLVCFSIITLPFHSGATEPSPIDAEKLEKLRNGGIGPDSKFKVENKKANFELQYKSLKNSEHGKRYGDDWESAQVQQMLGEIGFDLKYTKSRLKVNTFLRYAQSDLFTGIDKADEKIATYYAVHPQLVIPRGLAKIDYRNTTENTRQEVFINHLTYDWGDEEINFSVGRMSIVFGEGKTINPINPFNYNSALSNTTGINQGNDGFKFTLTKDPKVKLNFFFLGDKRFTDYNHQITRTIFLRGDWDHSKTIHVNYILGEDQKRHKYGIEVKKSLGKSFGFFQVVKFSKRLDNESAISRGLTHYLIGYEQDINDKWTMRGELGKFGIDTDVPVNDPGTFLPFDSVFAIYNSYKTNDKMSSEVGVLYDRASGASYNKISGIYQHNPRISSRIFTSGLMGQAKDSGKYLAQKFIPTEFGVALRASF